MAHGVVILECRRIPQSEVWARGYGVLSGLRIAPSSVSVVVRDSTTLEVTPGSPKAWEGHNSVNTCPNGASEESKSASTQSVDANGVVA